MLTTTMKLLSVGVLLRAVLWQPSAGYELGLQLVVCAGATLVALQASVERSTFGPSDSLALLCSSIPSSLLPFLVRCFSRLDGFLWPHSWVFGLR